MVRRLAPKILAHAKNAIPTSVTWQQHALTSYRISSGRFSWPMRSLHSIDYLIASHRMIASDRIRLHRRRIALNFPFTLFPPLRHLSSHTIMSSIPSVDSSDNERSDLNSASTPTSPGGLHESFQSLDSDSTNTNTTDDASVKTMEIDGEIYTNAKLFIK